MKRLLLLFTLLIIATGFYGAHALPSKTEDHVISLFQDMGFQSPALSGVSAGMDGLAIDKITLDEDGFSVIKDIKIKLNWFSNIASQNIESIEIKDIQYNALAEQVNPFKVQKWVTAEYLHNLPVQSLSIEHAQYDVATKLGDIRVEAKTLIQKQENGTSSVQAVFWGKQHQISFEVPISGVIKPDGRFLFESTFNDGKMNIGPVRLSRMNGWASSEGMAGEAPKMALQLTAGSGEIKTLPLQDITLTVSQHQEEAHTVLRAGVTSIPSAKLNLDILKKGEAGDQNAALSLELSDKDDLKRFLSLVKPENERAYFKNTKGPYLIQFKLLPERQFAGGPLPFEVQFMADDNNILNGHVLIYPVTLDVRGSLQGNTATISDMKHLLRLDDKDMPDDAIPLDLNLKDELSF